MLTLALAGELTLAVVRQSLGHVAECPLLALSGHSRRRQISPPPAHITSMSIASTKRSGWPRARSTVHRGSISGRSISWTARAGSSVGAPRRNQVAGSRAAAARQSSFAPATASVGQLTTRPPGSLTFNWHKNWILHQVNESDLR